MVLGLRDVQQQPRIGVVGELHLGRGGPESARVGLGSRVYLPERLGGGTIERSLAPEKEQRHQDESRKYGDTQKTLHRNLSRIV
jgi:hypothetical protein